MTSFDTLLQELAQLNLPKDEYAIFGSGPLAVRGLVKANDLDILVTKKLFKILCNKHPQKVSEHPFGCLVLGNIEIGDNWQGDSKIVDEYIENAEIINGFPFVKLNYVLEWKEISEREKDKRQARIIMNYLANKKSE